MKTTKSKIRCGGMLAILVLALGLAADVANADFTFGTPTNLGPPVNSSYGEGGVCISANGLEFYFVSDRPGGYGGWDLWVMKRPTIQDDWGDPVNLGSPVNSQYSYWEPSISSDGLSLYFSDGHSPQFGNRLPGGLGGQGDIWMITRETVHDAWGAPANIGPAVNSQHAVHPSISADGLSLYFQSHRPGHLGGHCDIMVATRESTSDAFGAPVFLKNVNISAGDWMPEISADGRTLLFCHIITESVIEIWAATRKTVNDDFGTPTKLPPQVNVPSRINASPSISADGSTLYFMSDRTGWYGGWDLWQVSIEPVVDFNEDDIVDCADICLMVDHWHQDEPAYDIAPPPFGDGIVDVQDLVVLAEHLLTYPGAVAYWKLDEAEGDIAHDSIGVYDGVLNGVPTWQPTGGAVDGALAFDGIYDYVSTHLVLNPSDGRFSVFVWIKGGAPGQVVLSQAGGANWLCTDSLEGNLMTELKGPGRGAAELLSQTIITDDNWHRIGLVWDGSHRTLYVDDVAVAEDTQANLEGSDNGLYIGAGTAMEPGSFWSGLIDDVRIYNRAITP